MPYDDHNLLYIEFIGHNYSDIIIYPYNKNTFYDVKLANPDITLPNHDIIMSNNHIKRLIRILQCRLLTIYCHIVDIMIIMLYPDHTNAITLQTIVI